MIFPRSAARVTALLFFPFAGFCFNAQAAVSPGEIAISELNCVACHDAPGAVKERLASRKSPKLGEHGVRVTPQWLRAFLANPQSEIPGTMMPDMLHALPAAQKAEAVEALTHFLISIQKNESGVQAGASTAAINAGRKLYHTVGCVACHAPFDLPPNSPDDPHKKEELAQLQKASLQFGNLATKYTVADLAAFLRNPLASRPSGRMPSLKLNDEEARAIAMYLLRDQVPAGAASKLRGLSYEYYEGNFKKLPDFDKLKPKTTGGADTFKISVAERKNDFAIRFRGIIDVPKDGEYTFFTKSDDGSRLFIDEKKIVENDGIHPAQEKKEKVKLSAGDHTITVTYFDGGGQVEFGVSWDGPDLKKEEIPASVLSHEGQPMRPVGEIAFNVDEKKAMQGANYFEGLQCYRCHGLPSGSEHFTISVEVPIVKPFAQLSGAKGCLAASPRANDAKFFLTEKQRADIIATLANQSELLQPLAPAERVTRTMTAMNCFACHNRDQHGGPDGLRRDYFVTSTDVDLGDEGRIPPHLNAVGAKLQSSWIKTVLTEGGAVRPYMATRMPQFGAANVGALPDAFEKADARAEAQIQPDVFAPGVASDANKFGRKLIGVGGLTCISCHNFDGNKSLGVPALDLATAGQRLKWDWFRRYLLDPQSLRPGTRMPTFWPDGVSANKEILGGDTEKQIFAIWAYLARKNFTDLPAGLVQAKMELVAENQALIYRNFIEGAGSRAIGVGYPEKINLAFDANAVRLALIWQGSFIDASKHRTGRGVGYEPPLGHDVVKLPEGAPFAVLASADAPWPKAEDLDEKKHTLAWTQSLGADSPWKFRGYTLDEKQRPAFRYTFGGVSVVDFFLPVAKGDDAIFTRTLTLHADKPVANFYFRAAVGTKIEEKNGAFVVDEKLQLKFDGAKPILRVIENKTELLVPVTFKNNEAKLVETLTW